MSDLWTTASSDVEDENLDRHLTTARIASAAVWPFLAAATSEVEYANRKALAADRIDRVAAAVAEGDPALFSVVRASLEDGFDQDFAVLHADRVATARIEATKTTARKEAEASIKAQAEREVLTKVLAVASDIATCGTCGLSWDDGKSTSMTPTPSGRCPFEHFHNYADGDPDFGPGDEELEPEDIPDDFPVQPIGKTASRKQAAGLENLGDAKAPKFGEDGKPVEEDEESTKEAAGNKKRSADGKFTGGEDESSSEFEPYEDVPEKDKDKYDKRESTLKTAGDSVEMATIPACDVCKAPQAAYDAKLVGLGGSWGYVCQSCFDQYGPGQTGTGYAQKLVQRSAARKVAISLTNVGIEGDNGVGTDPSGKRVTFTLSEKDKADLKAVLYSDMAINFSGVDVEQSDIITTASRKTAGIYCNDHDVWIGDGNADTHEGCSKEQKATEKTKDASRRHAADSTTCADCGNPITKKNDPTGQRTDAYAETHEGGSAWSKDGSDSHDWDFQCGMSEDGQHHPKTASRKQAADYAGGSPKEGDTARCHKDGGAIQFFDGMWMHLKGTGDSHNDVYPPNKSERNEVNSSRRHAGEDLFSLADGAYERQDRAWFYSLPTEKLVQLWGAVSAENFLTPAGAWDDEVADALAERGYFDKTSRRRATRKVAEFPPAKGGNPFGQKKAPTDADAGAPDQSKPDASNTDTWSCPNCQSSNAFTQGGVDLDEALGAKQPIQCGDCKQVDSTGGSAGTVDANGAPKQDQPSPGTPPVHASRRPFVPNVQITSGGYGVGNGGNTFGGSSGVNITYTAVSHPLVTVSAGNPYADDNPYLQMGTPNDQMDGPAVVPPAGGVGMPETTRPRVQPMDTAPVTPEVTTDPAAPPAPKKMSGFRSRAFKENS